MFTRIKTAEEIAAQRESGQMLAAVLGVLKRQLEPGMSSLDLSDIARTELKGLGGKPTFLGLYGFPEVLCVSINDEVVHGIPRRERIIKEGDIVGMDFGVTHKGMITDSAISVIAGKASEEAKRLVDMTKKALGAGIAVLRDGVHTGDIAHAVQTVLDGAKLGIVRDLVGHGVGHELHEDPNIPNYGKPGTGEALRAGMTIAIEPMATLGDYRVMIDDDRWTVRTRDGSLSAHFEHTILITENGSEILTQI